MKAFLWAFTLIGLLPLTALAIAHLVSLGIVARTMAREAGGAVPSFTYSTMHVNIGPASPMKISSQPWPAILILTGVLCCVFGLIYLIPKQPIRVSRAGYLELEPMIKRVLASSSNGASLVVSARDGDEFLSIRRRDSGLVLSVSAEPGGARLDAVKELFASRGVQPSDETTMFNEQNETEEVDLEFPLTGDSREVADVCIQVFRDLFGVGDDETIEITFEEE
ncbi:MAG: hypothetical protein K8H99_09855 [Nitrospirae bacterium]|nr:hypothetical protein [Fimbriimonadaceae bacterium]